MAKPFREWVNAHENIHWCATTFDSRRQPTMFDANWNLLDGDGHMGLLVKEWLSEKRDDHRPGETTPIPSSKGSAPLPPELVQIIQIYETGATVQWEPPQDTDGDEILQYRVTVADRDPMILRATERPTELANLNPNQAYEVNVTAIDEHGVESQPASAQFSTLDFDEPEATIPRTSSITDFSATTIEEWQLSEQRPLDLILWSDRPLETTAK